MPRLNSTIVQLAISDTHDKVREQMVVANAEVRPVAS